MTKSTAAPFVPSGPKYNFYRGHPNESLVPVKETQELLQVVVSNENESFLRDALNYGAEAGHKSLLNALAHFINRQSQGDYYIETANNETGEDGNREAVHCSLLNEASPHNLFVTMGVSHAVDMLVATLAKPGDLVLVERPTYFLIKGLFESHGLKVKGLPVKDDLTIDFDILERGLESGEIAAPRFIYVIPTNQNPTGQTMSYEDRLRLRQLASRFGFIVIADEVYHFLDWRNNSVDNPRPARMATFNNGSAGFTEDNESMPIVDSSKDDRYNIFGICISVSAFTKIFAPGVRLGWIEAPPSVINTLISHGLIQSQGGCSPFMGHVMKLGLETGIADKVLEDLRSSYRRRAKNLYQILNKSPHIRIRQAPVGGYFMWLEFISPAISSSEKVLEYCSPHLTFMVGSKCDPGDWGIQSTPGSIEISFKRCARFCFADMDEALLEEGADWFVKKIDEYVSLRGV